MNIAFSELKMDAKHRITNKQTRIIITSILFVVVVFLLGYLTTKLSNLDDYYTEYYKAYENSIKTGSLTAFDNLTYPAVPALAWVLLAAIGIMEDVIFAGFCGYCLKCSRNIKAGFRDIFESFAHFLKIFGITVMTGIVMLAWFFPVIAACIFAVIYEKGNEIFLVTAIILASLYAIILGVRVLLQYSLTYFVMFDNPDMTVIDCMKASRKLTKGRLMNILALYLSFFGWYILNEFLAALFLPVLNIWIYPYVGITFASYYNALVGKAVPFVPPVDEEPYEL